MRYHPAQGGTVPEIARDKMPAVLSVEHMLVEQAEVELAFKKISYKLINIVERFNIIFVEMIAAIQVIHAVILLIIEGHLQKIFTFILYSYRRTCGLVIATALFVPGKVFDQLQGVHKAADFFAIEFARLVIPVLKLGNELGHDLRG